MSANAEGGTAIVDTLAQYTAFMVMKHAFGATNMKKFLRYELDNYLHGRAQERNEEKPLYKVESEQGYIHYSKGGLVMYALQDYIGEAAVSRALAATYQKQADGKYLVHLSVEALKYRADGRGQEHAVPVHDLVDIGVLDQDGHYLYLQRQLIDRQNMEFDVTVDKVPATAGIDPLIKLIDRKPDDNAVPVESR